MKYTKEELVNWMRVAAWVNGYRVGRMQNGRYCIYRVTGEKPKRSDVVLTEAQFAKDMERGWH